MSVVHKNGLLRLTLMTNSDIIVVTKTNVSCFRELCTLGKKLSFSGWKTADSREIIGDNLKKIRKILFSVYIICVLWITLIDREWSSPHAMLVPFWEYANVIKGIERGFYIKQILENLIMLMPLGLILPTLKKVNLKQIFLIALLFSAGIETVQFITGRGLMEFDDVFNNTVGAVIGYKIYCKLRVRSNGEI